MNGISISRSATGEGRERVDQSSVTMALESAEDNQRERMERRRAKTLRILALLLSVVLEVVGAVAAPLLTRIYYLHGGARVWVTTLIQFAAFPIIFPFSLTLYLHRRRRGDSRVFLLSVKVMAASVALGFVSVSNAWLYAYGLMSLPVSTSTLLIATQIIFTALFAFLLVKQKFTAFTINAIVLLVVGVVLLGVQSSSDRPAGESNKRYLFGFFAMIAAAVLLGLLFPLVQWVYVRFKQKESVSSILEMQIIMSITATIFCAVAMGINYDYRALAREAEMFGLGKVKYYAILVGTAIFWQMMTIGFLGVIACSSALLAGVVLAMLLPVGEIVPVLLLGETFTSAKGIATVLCFWGFVSYLYGDYKRMKKDRVAQESQLAT